MTEENYRHHKEKGKHIAEQMTLTELASQMRNSSKSIKRLNIKQYNWQDQVWILLRQNLQRSKREGHKVQSGYDGWLATAGRGYPPPFCALLRRVAASAEGEGKGSDLH